MQHVNGEPALAMYRDGELFAINFCETDGERITAMYRVMNPDKLTGLR
jgi:RNA polymerase sigma-70 factor (ECF subfamily)